MTKAGTKQYDTDAQMFKNPRDKEFYWIGLPSLKWIDNQSDDSDFVAIKDNYISITPVLLDMTSHQDLDNLRSWI